MISCTRFVIEPASMELMLCVIASNNEALDIVLSKISVTGSGYRVHDCKPHSWYGFNVFRISILLNGAESFLPLVSQWPAKRPALDLEWYTSNRIKPPASVK